MLIVTHIAKTGGTTFLQYLDQVFRRRLYHDVSFSKPRQRSWSRRMIWRMFGCKWRVPRGTECIFGHFRATKYDRDYPDARHAVWFRDPVERLISAYHFLKRIHAPEDRLWNVVHGNDLSLCQFVELAEMQNQQFRILGGKPVAAFDFVGLTEHFAPCMQLFARALGLPEPSALPRANANPERAGQSYALDPSLREYVGQLNGQDYQVYQEATQRCAELARTFGVTLGSDSNSKTSAA